MSTRISRLRKKYKPKTKKVKILFVAESPPVSDDDEVRFFYNPRQERWDYMYRAVMEAVFSDFQYCSGEKDKWLRKFQKHGYYMIDATDKPVNRSSAAERRQILEQSVKSKKRQISKLVTKKTPIVLIKKNVFEAFNKPLVTRVITSFTRSFSRSHLMVTKRGSLQLAANVLISMCRAQ